MLIGIDVGGTKIEALAMNDAGEDILRRRVPTPRGDYDATVRAIGDLTTALEAEIGQSSPQIGVCIPGSVSPATGLVRNGNTTWINGRAFDADLTHAIGRPVRVANDGNCLALSEAFDGAGAGASSVAAVILGTGFGGGLVVGGRIVAGAHGIGAEFGHFPQPLAPGDAGNDDVCWCGRLTCGETYLPGPAVEREYMRRKGLSIADAPNLKEIAEMRDAEDPVAIQVFDQHLDRLARALSVIVNIVDPEVFVLGGGVSNIPLIVSGLPDAMRPHIFADPDDQIEMRVARAVHGDSSGVRGAARLFQ